MVKEFFKTILYEPLFNLLVFFAWLVPGHSIGWAILLLTLFIKIILWKLQAKPLKSQLEMKAHQGEIRALQEKYKNDRTAQAQAVMAYYKEHGINPMAGCLPLLIQLPVIIILYQVFVRGLQSVRPDLLYPFTPHIDSVNPFFFGIDLSKPDPWIFPLIAGVTQFLQSYHYAKLNQPTAGANDPAAAMAKQMTYLFPVMTFLFARSFPAGLALYWAASALFQLFQQWYVIKTFKVSPPSVSLTVRTKSKK